MENQILQDLQNCFSLEHNEYFENLRKDEYSYLDEKGQIYLDYTGGNVIPKQLLDKHFEFLRENVLGNPHSENPTSNFTTKKVEEARERVLKFFNAKEYYCVFTNNASSAIQIVSEYYSFGKDSPFLLTLDNHNSIHGIRGSRPNEKIIYVPLDETDLTIKGEELIKHLMENKELKNKLFSYPAQSNSSGVKHPLAWIKIAQELNWDVLLDAAAYVPTSKLDLSEYKPDFVCISFYKIFGYPTGIGCLLLRKDKYDKIGEKKNFYGGTINGNSILFSSPFSIEWSREKKGEDIKHEKFENGTLNYAGIPAITNGLNFIEEQGMDKISARVTSLANYLIQSLQELKHSNQKPLITIFGPQKCENRSGTVNMDFLDESGSIFSHTEIEKEAKKFNISSRQGLFCNKGVCLTINKNDSINSSGTNRISVGIATVKSDIDTFVQFVKSFENKINK